jgi:hypothetical protein
MARKGDLGSGGKPPPGTTREVMYTYIFSALQAGGTFVRLLCEAHRLWRVVGSKEGVIADRCFGTAVDDSGYLDGVRCPFGVAWTSSSRDRSGLHSLSQFGSLRSAGWL